MFLADRNAVIGIKSTVGLTSTLAVIPEARSIDTVGSFGRSVEDATIILDIIADKSSIPKSQADSVELSTNQYDAAYPYTSWPTTQDALKGAGIRLPLKRVWEAACQSTEEIIPPIGWDWEYAAGESGSKLSELEVVKVEFYQGLKDYLGTLEGNRRGILSLEDVVAYIVRHTDQEEGIPGTHPA